MKKYLLNALVLFTILLWQGQLLAQTPANDPNWEQVPVWYDEFSGSTINTTYWNVRNCYDHYHYRMENGVCVITEEDNQTVTSYSYTGADVELKDPYKIQYGYVEARVKINCGKGFFPAFWLFGVENGSQHQGSEYQEVDIFEMIYGEPTGQGSQTFDENLMTSNIHYTLSYINSPKYYEVNDYRYYHTYGLEWTPSKLIYYVDGLIKRIEINNGILDPKTIILNFAVHKESADHEINSAFPGVMYVDYVRLYKPRTDYSTTLNMNNYNFSAHDNKVKKKIVASGTNQLQTTDNVFLRATEGVEINGEFTVPVGAELYIDVNDAYY